MRLWNEFCCCFNLFFMKYLSVVAQWGEGHSEAGGHGPAGSRWRCKFIHTHYSLNCHLSSEESIWRTFWVGSNCSFIDCSLCSLVTETLQCLTVSVWNHQAEQRSDVPGPGLLGSWPPSSHTWKVCDDYLVLVWLVYITKYSFIHPFMFLSACECLCSFKLKPLLHLSFHSLLQAGDGGAAACQHFWKGQEWVCNCQRYTDPSHLVWDAETSVRHTLDIFELTECPHHLHLYLFKGEVDWEF